MALSFLTTKDVWKNPFSGIPTYRVFYFFNHQEHTKAFLTTKSTENTKADLEYPTFPVHSMLGVLCAPGGKIFPCQRYIKNSSG